MDTPCDLSFVFPCLNEERTLGACIREVRAALGRLPGLRYEIIVADNGSADRSREIAREEGARVAEVPARGYGAALSGGIAAARGAYVIFADADGTYLYEDAPALYETAVREKADMAIGSRIAGTIEHGAMPFLHRHLGTPVLTTLINVLFGGSLTDCNSGFRCVRREAFAGWHIRSTGMEFASELLIKALKARARIVEMPSGLRADRVGRVPHMRTWRDGMRHLLFIVSEKPQLFEATGLALVAATTVLQCLALALGQVSIAGVSILGIHTQVLALFFAIIGTQMFHFGAMCYVNAQDKPAGLTARIIGMDEGRLFFLLLCLLALAAGIAVASTAVWGFAHFNNINFANILVGLAHLVALPISIALGLLGVHVIKRYR